MMESNGLKEICGWLNKGMSEQHSADLRLVKHDGLTYILPPSQVFAPPIPKTEVKSMCGFNHPDITPILCPCKKLNSLEEDPDIIIGALQEGQFNTGAMNWLMLFYKEGVYNLEDKHMLEFADNDMAQICTQHAAKLAKTKQLSAYEHHAAEGLKFTSPPPKAVIPIPISALALLVSASHMSISTLTMSISATSTSSIFSLATAPPANESDLSPAPLDPEDEPAIHKAASCIPQPIPSASIITTNTAASSAPCPSAIPTGIANLKKGTTTCAKKPHHAKKANGF
ncbi:hypothetical protein J3A83DRAFT_4409299 [Scleroderma citrinum]